MATIALDIGGTKIASAIFFPDGSMMFNRKRLLKGRTGHEVGKLAADILAKLLTVARRSRIHVDGIGSASPVSFTPKPTGYGPPTYRAGTTTPSMRSCAV